MTDLVMKTAAATLGAILLATAGTAPSAAQDTLPRSGNYELRYTWVNPTTSSFGMVQQSPAEGDVAEAGAWIAWLMRNDGSEGFGHKMTGRCVGITRQNADVGFTLVAGNCVYTDQDGDRLYETYDGLALKWVAGTGKYAGITGTADLTDIVITAESGYFVLSGVKVGSYSFQ